MAASPDRSFEDRKATFAAGAALIIFPVVGILFLVEDVSENRARNELALP